MKARLPRMVILLFPLLGGTVSGCHNTIPIGRFASQTPTVTPTASETIAPASPTPTATLTATPTPVEPPHFSSGFDSDMTLEETDRMDRSASPEWWLNSGGWFLQQGGIGSTWIGEAPAGSHWREIYNRTNPWDTDQGAHPQNLFRLITRTEWRSPEQRIYFRITGDNFSPSTNREKSNGVLLFIRYRDADNLYYAGVRVDGSAVIKKKASGVYTTLAEAPWFPGTYNRASSPNLIPHQAWIGLRTVMQTDGETVTIQLYLDPDRSGFWILALQAEVDANSPQDATQSGYGGIRTDFMDVEFDDYRIEEM